MPSRREVAWAHMDGLAVAGGMRRGLDSEGPELRSEEDQSPDHRPVRGEQSLQRVGAANARPRTDMEALMVAAPHEEPQTSLDELLPLRDILQDAIDQLPERERFVVNACVVERMSLRAIAEQLSMGKSQIGNIREAGLAHLRELLEFSMPVNDYLKGQDA